MVYEAYKVWQMENIEEPRLPGFENYTSNKMFWLSFAHSFCEKHTEEEFRKKFQDASQTPFEFRVMGSLSNSPDFAKDFNCSVGSRMNPARKCFLYGK